MLLLGNEAIARGAIEAGVAVTAAYPGTPSSEISLNFFQMSQASDLYFEYSVNEKVSLEVTAAAANTGVRSMCVMKHVGMNVAADALMTLAYVGVKGGLVILVADDPFMFSETVPADGEVSENVELLLAQNGGHVGFVSGKFPWKAEYWYEQKIVEFLMNNE